MKSMEMNAQTVSATKKVALIVLDGWGVAEDYKGNAITQAKPAFFDYLLKNYPSTLLQASGNSVGLPWGEMGNSEVGHYTIGSGRIVKQSLYRINHEIETKRFFTNTALLKTLMHVKKNKTNLHIMGILGTGGVHGSSDHLFPLLELAKNEKVKNIYIHFILDGRDSPKDSARQFLKEVQKKVKKIHRKTQIASVCGRFYTMDRNNNWDRIEKAYNAMVLNEGEDAKNFMKHIEKKYAEDQFDEFIEPAVSPKAASIKDGDGIIFYNFRADRARQITTALSKEEFNGFKRKKILKNISFTSFTKYSDDLSVEIAFEREIVNNYLGKVLADNDLTQFRIAETEKYAHVTYFFNALKEEPEKGETRKLIPSPVVQSFATIPQMAAEEITQNLVKEIEGDTHDFYVVNFANADMVGHTGDYNATVQAVQIVDECVKKVVEKVLKQGMVAMITADHGNAENEIRMLDKKVDKEHSTNPVPFIIIDDELKNKGTQTSLDDQFALPVTGVLADIAPTILSYYNLPRGDGMTGIDLREVMMR